MKKTAVIASLLLSVSVLYAQVYRSNLLGQKLYAVSSIPSSGYALEEDGDTSVLYLDGRKVRVLKRTTSGNTTIETEIDAPTGRTATRTYTDGLLTSETGYDGRSISYAYVEGRLAFSSETAADGAVLMTFFLRSADDGVLMAVKEGDSLRFVNDSYIFQNDDLLQQLAADLVVGTDHEILEDGNIRYEENGITYTYSPSGKLLTKEENGAVSEYFYTENRLVRVETVDGNQRSVETYQDGTATGMTVYENGVIVSMTTYRKEGNIQTLYRDGRMIATVYYRQDNRTVDRIEYN